MKRIALFAVVLASMLRAHAQTTDEVVSGDCTDIIAEARNDKLHGFKPVAGAEFRTTMVALSIPFGGVGEIGNCRVLSFYRLLPPEPRDETSARRTREMWASLEGAHVAPLLVARRVAEYAPPMQPLWAASNSCPAVEVVLKELEAILTPALTSPQLLTWQGASEQPYYAAWVDYPVQTPFRDDRFQLNLAGGEDSQLAKWLDQAHEELAQCWEAEPPAPVPPISMERPN